ncbi:NlpC/P60 family protein, partial [Clostridium tyrobutyricum]
GGTTPSGFDCSGFVQYVYAHFGISLPRVSQDQQNVGAAVSRANLQPGDLVFFGNPAYHVGIYVGSGTYINAPKTGDVVKIASVDRSDFSGGRRINGVVTQIQYSKDFIASVQRDLRHCSFYTASTTTGVLDQNTKDAIWNFRRVMGLPVNTTLDASVVNALNDIVHKPRLAVNTEHSYATRFVQWWIGATVDGKYTTTTQEQVRQWQIKAGIWSASGADGVIRDKDWGVMLRP